LIIYSQKGSQKVRKSERKKGSQKGFVVMTISDLGFAFMGMVFKLISEVITGKR